MDVEGEDMGQGNLEPVKKVVEEGGKSRESKSAGRKKPTAHEVINSHRLSLVAATATTRPNINQEENSEPGGG